MAANAENRPAAARPNIMALLLLLLLLLLFLSYLASALTRSA
jgi:hypothetical protein